MKKMLMVTMMAALVAGIFSTTTQAAQSYPKSDLTALILSGILPGVGEWYNTDFKGSFPLAECTRSFHMTSYSALDHCISL